MKELIVAVVLLVVSNALASGLNDPHLTEDPLLWEIVTTNVTPAETRSKAPIENPGESTPERFGEPNEDAFVSVDAKSDLERLKKDDQAITELEVAETPADIAEEASVPQNTPEPISLDELLRQTRNTPHLKQEALLVRLAERRRLAVALRSTLEAAEQVAAFGQPSTQLLKDASLETIVETMIRDQERKGDEREKSLPIPAARETNANPSESGASGEEGHLDPEFRFDGWRPVYVLNDARGHRVGWRHQRTGEREITYVGDHWHIGESTLTVVGVATDSIGRYVVVHVNGERREIHL